ncbi:hypothetical protein AAG906_010380 [Vitis piasezkii]
MTKFALPPSLAKEAAESTHSSIEYVSVTRTVSRVRSPQPRLEPQATSFVYMILCQETPRHFSMPKFNMYDGSGDPFNHFMHFRQRANKYSMLDDDLCASLQRTKALAQEDNHWSSNCRTAKRSTSHVGNKRRTKYDCGGLPGLDPCTMILANEIKLGSITFT